MGESAEYKNTTLLFTNEEHEFLEERARRANVSFINYIRLNLNFPPQHTTTMKDDNQIEGVKSDDDPQIAENDLPNASADETENQEESESRNETAGDVCELRQPLWGVTNGIRCFGVDLTYSEALRLQESHSDSAIIVTAAAAQNLKSQPDAAAESAA